MKIVRLIPHFSAVISIFHLLLSIFLYRRGECILNEGIAFGIPIDYIMSISTVLILSLFLLSRKMKVPLNYFFSGLSILALGNLLGRFVFSGVCDYVALFFVSVNIVDIGIVLLCSISIFYTVFYASKR